MLDLKSLSKVPEEAVSEIIMALLAIVPANSQKLENQHYKKVTEIRVLIHAAKVALKRVQIEEIESTISTLIDYSPDQTCNSYREDLNNSAEAIFAAGFEDHFLDQDCIEEFDTVRLSKDEKQEIRSLLSKARELTDNAEFLSNNHKRRINHRISEVESELYNEITGFKAFLTAAADVSGLVKKFGNDAKPLAEAIQTARTITERKVEGYKKLEAEEKPKALPKPDESAKQSA